MANLGDLIPYEIGEYEILIPNQFDQHLRNKISAAIISHVADYKSIDYVLKKYHSFTSDTLDNKSITSEIIEEVKKSLKDIEHKHRKIKYKEDKIAIFGVHTALKRLKTSYESCILLINLGCYFEANCILRMIFEQLCYCINICDLNNEEYKLKTPKDNIFDTTYITNLKKIVKNIDIGRLYNNLSKKAHLDISEIYKYVKFDHTLNETIVILRDKEETSICALLLYIVCYIHEIVLEYSFKEYLNEFNFIEIGAENKFHNSIPNEKYQKVIDIYKKIYK